MSHKRFLAICHCILLAALNMAIFLPVSATAESGADEAVKLISPEPGEEIIAKRPDIAFTVDPAHSSDTILVLLDGTDVTGIVNAAPDGYVFRPIEMLGAGQHVLQVFLTAADGSSSGQEFFFSSRHSRSFEENYSRNDISIALEKTLKEPDDATYQTDYKASVNLADESVVKEQQWEMRFNTNLRYLAQDLSINAPLEKGINLANYLLAGTYNGDRYQAFAEFGDVNVSETQNTINLARRGGTFAIAYEGIKVKTFMVNSEEVFGFTGGTGLSGDTDDHIMGISGEFGLFSDKIRLKTIYATGGETGDSYNIYTLSRNTEGSVLGFLATSAVVENKLNIEAELDFSSYDPDTSDEFSDEDDRAFRVGANGYWDSISYGALYEYIGTDYQVVGNPYLQGDREGVAANFGISHNVHNASVALSRYNDNVDDNPLYAQTDMLQGAVNYSYSGIANMPLGLAYQHAELETSKEPENTPHYENVTDSITGTVNYLVESWNFGFMTGYSEQNDKTLQNYDTEAFNTTLSVSYLAQFITITPSVSFNRSTFKPTNVDTDTRTFTLDLRGNAWEQRITYELGGTFSRTETSDQAMEQDIYNTNFRIAYTLASRLWGMNYPALGLMGNYYGSEDHVYNSSSDEFTLLFVFSTSIPFVL